MKFENGSSGSQPPFRFISIFEQKSATLQKSKCEKGNFLVVAFFWLPDKRPKINQEHTLLYLLWARTQTLNFVSTFKINFHFRHLQWCKTILTFSKRYAHSHSVLGRIDCRHFHRLRFGKKKFRSLKAHTICSASGKSIRNDVFFFFEKKEKRRFSKTLKLHERIIATATHTNNRYYKILLTTAINVANWIWPKDATTF